MALARVITKSESQEAEFMFLLGSAYGYRALECSTSGHWWGTLKDGHHSCVSLEKAYRLDTTMTDALLGVGDYHYWKSAKSKFFTWLPFIRNERQSGIGEIRRVIQSGSGALLSARKSLLPTYFNEQRFPEVIALVDSLASEGFSDPSCLRHKTRAEIELGNWNGAAQTLDMLRAVWDRSPFFDSCGACEVQYLKAQILAGRGDMEAARACVQKILAMKDSCMSNVYFRETVSNAAELFH